MQRSFLYDSVADLGSTPVHCGKLIAVAVCTAFLIAILLLGTSVPSRALEFTADRVTKMDGRTERAVVYYRDNMWRIEHHTNSPVNVSIVRKDQQVVWLLLSRMKHFKTVPYSAKHDLMVTEKLAGEVSREVIGQEMREGHPTTLYEVTTNQSTQTEVYYQWLATDLHFPMKIAKKDGSWIVEYQHVKIRAVSDYLFQLPVNFHPLEEFKKDIVSETQ